MSKNFVLKIHCGKPNFARQIKFAWQWKSENQTLWINVVLSFKFRKYKTAFNNGLKIWLLPDFPAENPLLNGMFCYFCNGLVLHLRHIFKPRNVVGNIFSELTLKASLLLFLNKLLLKILRENWKPNRTLSINFVLKLRFRENPLWNENLKLNVAWKKLCVTIRTLPKNVALSFLSSENIMQHTTAV